MGLSLPQFCTIYGSCVLEASSPHSLHHSHNNQLFPCVVLKFPTHFMVTLNDLIICLHISKTDFSPTNSFPWKPKGDAIKAASELRWAIKNRKKQWYQLKHPTDFTPRGIHFDVDYLSRGTCKTLLLFMLLKYFNMRRTQGGGHGTSS